MALVLFSKSDMKNIGRTVTTTIECAELAQSYIIQLFSAFVNLSLIFSSFQVNYTHFLLYDWLEKC